MSKQLQIRNSTAEFLIFQAEDKAQGVQVFYQDENIWATQKAMSELYGIDKSGISRHLANIYASGELRPEMTVAKIATVVNRGIRGEVTEEIDYYNLDAIISVGYRVNSVRATQFRRSMPRRNLRSTASFRIGCLSQTLTGLHCRHCRLTERMKRKNDMAQMAQLALLSRKVPKVSKVLEQIFRKKINKVDRYE